MLADFPPTGRKLAVCGMLADKDAAAAVRARSMSSCVACSSHSPFTCTAGAPPHAARHSISLTVNLPSGVVPPGSMPSFLQVS